MHCTRHVTWLKSEIRKKIYIRSNVKDWAASSGVVCNQLQATESKPLFTIFSGWQKAFSKARVWFVFTIVKFLLYLQYINQNNYIVCL